jgi:hypothetical protein
MTTKPGGIYREVLDFETNFTQIPNGWVRDPNLTMKAKGLLTYLLSHEAGFTLTLDRISRDTKDERTAIRSAVGELVKNNYVVTKQGRQRDGRLGPMTWVIQNPLTASQNPTADNPTAGNPTAGNVPTIEEHLKEDYKEEEQVKETIDQHFETFYRIYPLRMKRERALKAFRTALASATVAEVLEGATRFANDPNLPAKGFIPYPATWLNAGSWEDEPLPDRPKSRYEREDQAERDYEVRKAANDEGRKRDKEYVRSELERARLITSAPPKCLHGSTVARCVRCLNIMKQETEGTK